MTLGIDSSALAKENAASDVHRGDGIDGDAVLGQDEHVNAEPDFCGHGQPSPYNNITADDILKCGAVELVWPDQNTSSTLTEPTA